MLIKNLIFVCVILLSSCLIYRELIKSNDNKNDNVNKDINILLIFTYILLICLSIIIILKQENIIFSSNTIDVDPPQEWNPVLNLVDPKSSINMMKRLTNNRIKRMKKNYRKNKKNE